MLVDLIRVQTSDGCMLDGALERVAQRGADAWPFDAVVLFHGTGSNFYQSTLLEFLAERFRSRGVASLRANTRGHDGISTLVTSRGGQRVGAAYEVVDDCRHDLAAWVGWLRQNVGPRVILFGHSLGALKCVYAAAHDPNLAPDLVVALSPPRLAYGLFAASEKGPTFLDLYRQAEAAVAAGRGGALIETTVPLPMVISSAGFVDKYGPAERYDLLPLVQRLRAPSAFVYGATETVDNLAFRGLPEAVTAHRHSATPLVCRVVPGADHFYSGVRPALWETLAAAIGA